MEEISILSLLEGLGRTSLQAGVLVVVILAVQWLLRKQLPPRWRCALWLLVAARLLLPVSISSAASIFNLIPPWTANPQRGDPPSVRPTASDSATTASLPLPTREPMNSQAPLEPPTAGMLKDSATRLGSGLHTRPATVEPVAAGPRVRPLSWIQCLFGAWICGVIAMGAYVLLASLRLARRFAGLKPVTDAALLAVLKDCQLRMKIQNSPKVVESGGITCPALYGLFRPRLVLPVGFSSRFSERELRFIFLHELAHLKRLDLPINWVIACLQVLHWFNPLVWIGFACWRSDRELACDAMALDAVGTNQNTEYGQTILRLLAGFTHAAPAPGLVGILESKKQLRRRIGMIASYVPGRRWQLLALAVAAVIGVTCLTDAQVESPVPASEKDAILSVSSPKTNQVAAVDSRLVVTNGRLMKVIVLDDETGKPLAGAEVLAHNKAALFGFEDRGPLWITGDDGRADIHLGEVSPSHLSQQTWFTLSVRHREFAPRGKSLSAGQTDVRPNLPAEVVVRLRRGITVGGFVRDEKGSPVPGVRVRIYGAAYWEGFKAEYPEYWTDGPNRPTIVTDEQGRFEAPNFPADLKGMIVELTPQGGSLQRFRKPYDGWEDDPRKPGEPIDLAAFRSGKAVFVIKYGFEVRGVLLDPEGRPAPNVLIKAGTGGQNEQRFPDFRTDASGRFKLGHLLRRQLILTAYPTNFAIVSTVVDPNPNTPEVQMRLSPQQPLRIRVVDGEGNAVGKAKVWIDSLRTKDQMLDFSGETDQNGILVWSNAPLSSFALRASSATPRCQHKIRVGPNDREITFKLRNGMSEEVVVTANVRDAKTGRNLKIESARYRVAGGSKRFEFAGGTKTEAARLRIPATYFRPGMYPSYQLEFQLEGHRLLITPWRDFDEGDWEANFTLQPVSRATVLLPDGKPAANAEVWTRAAQNDGFLHCYSPTGFSDEGMVKLRADADGQFILPNLPDDQPLVFAHSVSGELKWMQNW